MKKLFSLVALAFCLAVSAASYGQSILLLADNVQGPSLAGKNGIDVLSMGTSLACGGCLVTPLTVSGSGAGKTSGGKIVFNMKNDVSVNTLRTALTKGSITSGGNGNAYFIFSKNTGAGKPLNYYYVKLTNYTVIEIDEATDTDGSTSIQVSLGYSGITWTTKPISAAGIPGNPSSYGWDFTRNADLQGSAIPSGY